MALAVALAGCASAPLSDNAGVRVVGDANTVRFGWDADHPWAQQFQTPARFHLYAQYRSDGQLVEQDLGVARSGVGGGWVFMLPAMLRSTPDSPVCLLMAVSRQSAAVPVRLKPPPGADTGRFRYPAWEARTTAETRQQSQQRETAVLAAQFDELSGAYSRLRTELQRNGSLSDDDCRRAAARIAAPAAADATPSDVIAPAQQADATQRICVRRARNMRMVQSAIRVDMPDYIGKFVQESPPGADDRLRPMGTQFLQHWSRWVDRTGVDYTPEVGDPGDRLPVVRTVNEALVAWNRAGGGDSSQRRAIAAGLLDAYGGCLEDVRKQLMVKHDAWQRAQANKPLRDRLFAERQLAVCQGRVAELRQIEAAMQETRTRLDAQRGAEHASPSPSLPSGPQAVLLNGQTCTL